MSRLFSLKSWLTLEEAAEHLGRTLEEPVAVADVLRLATQGHLVLSVNFVNHTNANLGKKVAWEDARLVLFPNMANAKGPELPSEVAQLLRDFPRHASRQEQHEFLASNRELSDHPDIIITIKGDRILDGVLEWDGEKVASIEGLWDLPTTGGAALDIEHLLQSLVGGPEVTLTCLDGVFVVSTDGQTYARLLEHYGSNPYVNELKDGESAQERGERLRKYPHGDPRSYYPRGGLPDDAPIVVRPEALAAFISSLTQVENGVGSTEEKPLLTRERNNLLRIIAALAAAASIEISDGGKGSLQIEKALELAGFDGPKEKAIRKVLAEIRSIQ